MRLKCRCKKENRARFFAPTIYKRNKGMKKIVLLLGLISVICVAGCCTCENEPIIEANHKLIVPPNFGNMPK